MYGTEGTIFTDVTRDTPLKVFSRPGVGYMVEKAESDTGWLFPPVDEAWTYGYREEMRHFIDCVAAGSSRARRSPMATRSTAFSTPRIARRKQSVGCRWSMNDRGTNRCKALAAPLGRGQSCPRPSYWRIGKGCRMALHHCPLTPCGEGGNDGTSHLSREVL